MRAFGQAGVLTVGRNRFVDHFGVTQCCNCFLGNKHFTTVLAVLTLGQSGVLAIGCNSSIDHFIVTRSGNNFLGNQNFATFGAVLALGLTVFGTGNPHSLIDHFGMGHHRNVLLCYGYLAAHRAMLALGLTGSSTGGGNSSIGCFSMDSGCFCHIILITIIAVFTGIGGITGIFTGRFCHHAGVIMFRAYPTAGISIVDICASNLGGIHKETVSIFQFCRAYRDFRVAGVLYQLICNALLGRGNRHLASAFGNNIGTAICGICCAQAGIHSAVNHSFCIYQISLCTGICLTGCILYRNNFFVGSAAEIAPLIYIIEINLAAVANCCRGALSDDQLCTGQQRHILGHCNVSALYINRNIVIDRKHIVGRIKGVCTYAHFNGGNIHIAIDFHHQTILRTIIPLGY